MMIQARAYENLIGKKFGKWTVIDKAPTKGSVRYWLCRCECGAPRDVQESNLIGGYSKSCGCYRYDKAAQRLTR